MISGLPIIMCRLRKESVREDRTVAIRRKQLRDNSNVLAMPEQEFLSYFKMDKHCFIELLDDIAPLMKRFSRSTSVPPMIKLASFLRFLTAGSFQKAVGNEHIASMSQAKVSIIIYECLDIFEQHICPKWIRIEMSEEEEAAVKEKFYFKFGLPGVIGCVDAIHVKIRSPSEQKHLYYNKKGYYSINAMLICDSDMVIRYVDGRAPGANRDAFVWKTSLADDLMKSAYNAGKRNSWLLGDSGYQLLPYLMTPYRQPQHRDEVVFNTKLCRARNVVERCFGMLKNRFGCIKSEKGLHYSPEIVTKIINACCALHNICLYNKTGSEYLEETEDSDSVFSEEEEPSAAAVSVRDELAQAISC